MNSRSKYWTIILLILDISFISFLFFIFLEAQYVTKDSYKYSLQSILMYHYKALLLFLVSWIFISQISCTYKMYRNSKISEVLKNIFYQNILFSIIIFATSGLKTSDLLNPKLSIYYILSLFFFTIFMRCLLFISLKIYRSYGKNDHKVIFIDKNNNTSTFIDLLRLRKDYGFSNLGLFTKDIEDEKNNIYIFDISKIKEILSNDIQTIYISIDGKINKNSQRIIVQEAEKMHISIKFIPNSIYSINNLNIEYYDTFPILTFNKFPLDNIENQILKRIFDVFFSLFIFIFILSWLLPIISIAVLITSKGSIFFKQRRNGLMGRPFYCYKFRTMKPNKEANIKSASKNDCRITKVGKFLRKTSLDELPQFINVLKGDMSVVGPRPHMIAQDEYYNKVTKKYSLRHYVKPGITGLAQTKGLRGEIFKDRDMQKRIIADVYYVKNWSFGLDLIIIFKTFVNVIIGDKNAY